MEVAPARAAAVPVSETPMAPSFVVSAMEPAEPAATSPGRCRGRSESGRAESGGGDESDADLAKHDDLLWLKDAAFCCILPRWWRCPLQSFTRARWYKSHTSPWEVPRGFTNSAGRRPSRIGCCGTIGRRLTNPRFETARSAEYRLPTRVCPRSHMAHSDPANIAVIADENCDRHGRRAAKLIPPIGPVSKQTAVLGVRRDGASKRGYDRSDFSCEWVLLWTLAFISCFGAPCPNAPRVPAQPPVFLKIGRDTSELQSL